MARQPAIIAVLLAAALLCDQGASAQQLPPSCSAAPATVAAFNTAVRASVTGRVAFGGSISGTFEHSISGCNPANSLLCSVSTAAEGRSGDFQNGYCIDADKSIDAGTSYSMVAYSSLSAVTDMKCPDAASTALIPGVTSDSLNRVNWLLNTYYNPLAGINPQCSLPVQIPAGTYQSQTDTSPGLQNPATKVEVQRAVWAILGSDRYSELSVMGSDAVVNCMLWNAYNASLPQGWAPPCSGTAAVVLIPCSNGVVNKQPTIAQIPMAFTPGGCNCSTPSDGPVVKSDPCDPNAWSLSYTQGWWKNQYCGTRQRGPCQPHNALSACSLQVPAFDSLAPNLQGVLSTSGCNFTATSDAATTRNELCGCVDNPGAPANSAAYVLNVLVGSSVTVTAPSGPNGTCTGTEADYNGVGNAYVCSKPGVVCPCPTSAIGTWTNAAGNDCRDFVANAADEGKCLPATLTGKTLSDLCVLQNCGCEEGSALPSPEPEESPSPSPAPESSPSPSPEPLPESPSPSPEPQESPSPSPEPEASPSPSPEPEASPSPSPTPVPPSNCSAAQSAVASFSAALYTSAQMMVEHGGDVTGYFRHTISNCDPASPLCLGSTYNSQLGVYEGGYCIDATHFIQPGEAYSVVAVSSYSPNLDDVKCPGSSTSPLPALNLTPGILRKINWLLNNYLSPITGQATTCTLPVAIPDDTYFEHLVQGMDTPAGTYPVTGDDMQQAVWLLTDNPIPNEGSDDAINCLVYNANAANVSEQYTPPCDGTMAVILVPCNNEGPDGDHAQISITQVPLPVECTCEELGPLPSPEPVASPSPSPEPLPESPSPSPEPEASPSPSPGPEASPSPSPEPEASPSPAPVPSPSPSPEPLQNCTAPADLVNDFGAIVQTVANVSVAFGDGTIGYFRHWISDCDPESRLCWGSTYDDQPGQYENGYCIDTENFITPGEIITMATFSSYVDVNTIKCPGASSSPLNSTITNEIMRRLNWLLNNFYNPQQGLPSTCTVPDNVSIPEGVYQNDYPTGPGPYDPITKEDMQAAVWVVTGNLRAGVGGDFQSDNDVVNCLVYNTMVADVPPTYTPPCNGVVAVVLVPCDQSGQTTEQITVASVSFNSLGLECICEEPVPLPSPEPSPSPSPEPEASPSPSPQPLPESPSPSPEPEASPSPSPEPEASPSPSPEPVPSPSPTPEPVPLPNCTAPISALQQFSAQVRTNATASVAFGASVVGYFRHTLTQCNLASPLCGTWSTFNNQPGVYENGYCIDTTRFITPGTVYNVSTFSSYDPTETMLCPGSSTSSLRPSVTQFNDSLVKVNWLLNTYFQRGQGFAPSCTLDTDLPPDDFEPQDTWAGTYGPITDLEMQAAVWSLTGNPSGSEGNRSVINCLIYNTLFADPSYRPPCGGTVAVVVIPCSPDGSTPAQVMIASVPLDCECEDEGPLPDSSPSPSPEPAMSPSPSPQPLPEESPSPSPEPEASPSPSPEPEESPSPSPEPEESPSPSPEPVPSPSPAPEPTPLPESNCSAPLPVVNEFNSAMQTNANMSVAYGGQVVGYFRHYFTGCNPASPLCTGSTFNNQPGVYENGYCIDTTRIINAGTIYNASMFSSYTDVADIKCPGSATSPLRAAITNERLRRVNWLLNSYYNPQLMLPTTCGLAQPVAAGQYFPGSNGTAIVNYGPITFQEMQGAIWVLTGNARRSSGIDGNDDVVNCLIHNTLTVNISAGYAPPCDGTIAVVVLPCSPTGSVPAQITIAQVSISSVPVECSCEPETGPLPSPEPETSPSPSPEPEASPSPSPEPEPSPSPRPEESPSPSPEPESSPSPSPEPEASPSPSPEPEASPSPSPEPEASPSPSPQPLPESPSPSPEPEASPSPSPEPGPLPGCDPNAWSLSYTQGWWKNQYCGDRDSGPCQPDNALSACSLQVPAFDSLAPNLQGVLSTSGCNFTATSDAATTRNELCGCVDNPGAPANSAAYVLNVLVGSSVTVTAPSGPNGTCTGTEADYNGVGNAYVCSKFGAVCPCPTSAIGTWTNAAGNDCRDFVANAADEGKCLPATLTSKTLADLCVLQNCGCEEGSALPSPEPEESPSPSPQPLPEESPSPSPEPEASPSPSPEPEASPSPSPEPEESPSPSPEPEASPSPSPEPEASPSPSPEPEESPSPSPEPEESPSPSPEPVPSPSPTPPPPEPCNAPLSLITGLNSQVQTQANVRVDAGPGVLGYFRHTVTNCRPRSPLCTGSTYQNITGVWENGYCIDTSRNITPGVVYPMRTYSSFAMPSTIRCPGARTPPLNPNITSDTLRRLNWLLNSYYNPQRDPAVTTCTLSQNVTAGWYQSSVGTAADTYGPITNVDMQAAVWVLTGNARSGKAGWLPGESLPPASNDIVNCLLYNAFTADVPESYTPPCGGTMAVIALPCDVARATGMVRAQMVRTDTYTQVTVTQVPVRCECVPLASPSP